ncbi:MAG: hypothetical protein AAFN70_15170, partial [Planctomycetota bacterium]
MQRSRRHLLETLERRDHPGGMWDISMMALLGMQPEGKSDDPVDQMMQSAAAQRNRRDQVNRLLASGNQTFRRAENAAPSAADFQTADPQQRDAARRRWQDRLLELQQNANRQNPAAQNPLLQSITQQQLTAQIDEADPAADATTRNNAGAGIQLPVGDASGSGAGSIGGGGVGSLPENVPS